MDELKDTVGAKVVFFQISVTSSVCSHASTARSPCYILVPCLQCELECNKVIDNDAKK